MQLSLFEEQRLGTIYHINSQTRMVLKLGKRARQHFVTLIKIDMHIIARISEKSILKAGSRPGVDPGFFLRGADW